MKRFVLLSLILPMVSSIFAQERSPEAEFWNWFVQHNDALFNFESDQDRIFDELAIAMRRVHPDLAFEFGPKREDGTREFVISAGGNRVAFPSVEAIYASAPKLPNWRFVKFRPRRTPLHDISFGDHTILASNVHSMLFRDDDPEKVGIVLFIDGYNEKEHDFYGQVGYLFLDEALGEYDVETRVGGIAFESPASEYFEHARPLKELAKQFDEHFANH